MQIKSILVSAVAPFNNHIANGGEKILGNASSIKRRPDGRVYVSGQMQRHVFFSAVERLNSEAAENNGTFVSTGDGITNQIEKDLRADMGGFMHPSKGDYSGRRTAPMSVTPAVSTNASDVGRDLLVRIRMTGESKEQALATREYSQSDEMLMNFFLDISALSISRSFEYKDQLFVAKKQHRHADDTERMRRAMLFLNATRYMNDYANQARNAVCGEPCKVLIVLSPLFSRKASRYFETKSEIEQRNLLAELDAAGANYYLGDDTTENSVRKAYEDATSFLQNQDNQLYDPSGGATVETYAEYLASAASAKPKSGKKEKNADAEQPGDDE